ncbi:MAG TPA: AAA family ATPase [Acidobacteriota bacterium]|nr:AAA family ATPase [Acidobacteriota bacterium]
MALAILSQKHLADLRLSGLSDETIHQSGFYTATEDQVREILKFDAGPGLAIPYRSQNSKAEFVRVKPNTPFVDRNGKPHKYLSAKGSGNRLYIPPMITPEHLRDNKIPLYITEGEKKALKGCQEGLCCIAIPGVWSWKQRNGNRSVPIPDLDLVEWKYRSTYLVFDSDLRAKKEVATALYELSRELERRRAHVRKIDLPDGPKGEKCGLDDYLLTHSLEAFCSLPHSPVLPPEFQYIEITPVTEFIRKTLPNREAIIGRGLLYPRSRLGLTGPGKKGKSMLVQNMILSLAAGIPVLGQFPIPLSRRVVYIQSEVSPHAMQDRLKKMIDSRGGEDLRFHSATLVNAPNLKIDSKEGYRAIEMILEQSKAEVAVFDPLYRLHVADENRANEMRAVIDLFDRLIEKFGIALIAVHHHGKQTEGRDESQFSRGSSVFTDWIDTQLIFRGQGETVDGRLMRKLSFVLRNDVEPEPLTLILDPETLWFEVQEVPQVNMEDKAKTVEAAEAIWKAGGVVNRAAIEERLGVDKNRALALLKLLPTDEWEKCTGPRNSVFYRPKPNQPDPEQGQLTALANSDD